LPDAHPPPADLLESNPPLLVRRNDLFGWYGLCLVMLAVVILYRLLASSN
jgi:hypothetical protein